jgi:hypothetical protein
MSATERFAANGAIWVCCACGKTHSYLYGVEGSGSAGWDESCSLNAVLCHEEKQFDTNGFYVWVAFKPVEGKP